MSLRMKRLSNWWLGYELRFENVYLDRVCLRSTSGSCNNYIDHLLPASEHGHVQLSGCRHQGVVVYRHTYKIMPRMLKVSQKRYNAPADHPPIYFGCVVVKKINDKIMHAFYRQCCSQGRKCGKPDPADRLLTVLFRSDYRTCVDVS